MRRGAAGPSEVGVGGLIPSRPASAPTPEAECELMGRVRALLCPPRDAPRQRRAARCLPAVSLREELCVQWELRGRQFPFAAPKPTFPYDMREITQGAPGLSFGHRQIVVLG